MRGHERAGVYPVLIISHDAFNDRSGTVIAVARTGQRPVAGFPLTMDVRSVALPRRSWVKISQVRTLSVQRLSNRVGAVTPEELKQVIEGLNDIVAG